MRLPRVAIDPDADDFTYDEFAFFEENCAEYDLLWDGPPVVDRIEHRLADGRVMRGLRWGTEPVRIVWLHGGASPRTSRSTMCRPIV